MRRVAHVIVYTFVWVAPPGATGWGRGRVRQVGVATRRMISAHDYCMTGSTAPIERTHMDSFLCFFVMNLEHPIEEDPRGQKILNLFLSKEKEGIWK